MTVATEKKGSEEKPADETSKAKLADEKNGKGSSEHADSKDELTSLKAYNQKLQDENKERRLAEKEMKARLDKFQQGLDILTGKSGETPDPAKMKEEAMTAKVRNAYLKAAFVGVAAKDMHDADFAFSALKDHLADVEVDTETGKVDTGVLGEKLTKFRESHKWMFVQSPGNGTETPPKPAPKPAPDGNGRPSGQSNAWADWQNMLKQGRKDEAQDFFAKNKTAIYANWPKAS